MKHEMVSKLLTGKHNATQQLFFSNRNVALHLAVPRNNSLRDIFISTACRECCFLIPRGDVNGWVSLTNAIRNLCFKIRSKNWHKHCITCILSYNAHNFFCDSDVKVASLGPTQLISDYFYCSFTRKLVFHSRRNSDGTIWTVSFIFKSYPTKGMVITKFFSHFLILRIQFWFL